MKTRAIQRLQTVLAAYSDNVRKVNQRIEHDRNTYLPDVFKEREAEALNDLHRLAREARQEIETVKNTEIDNVNEWARMNGAKIDSGDLALLNGAFDLSGKDIDALVAKHKDNATMLNAIGKYYEQRQSQGAKDGTLSLSDAISIPAIPTAKNKTDAIIRFARHAENLVAGIENNPSSVSSYKDKDGLSDATSTDMLVAGFGTAGMSDKKDFYVLED